MKYLKRELLLSLGPQTFLDAPPGYLNLMILRNKVRSDECRNFIGANIRAIRPAFEANRLIPSIKARSHNIKVLLVSALLDPTSLAISLPLTRG